MPTKGSSPESTPKLARVEKSQKLIVSQPKQMQSIMEMVGTLELMDTMSERLGEDKSGDMGGGGTGGTGGQQDDGTQQSQRSRAIANLPNPPVMQKKLTTHIEKEIKKLSKQVKREARRASKPGAAYRLNKLYARMRTLNRILGEVLDSTYDVLKRIYIRVIIDRQSIL